MFDRHRFRYGNFSFENKMMQSSNKEQLLPGEIKTELR